MKTKFETTDKLPNAAARERLRAELESLSRDAEDLLKATAGDMSEKSKEVRSRVAAALERAKTTCAHWQDQTAATAQAAATKVDTVIRTHPYEFSGVAFGIGLLIGVLVTRK